MSRLVIAAVIVTLSSPAWGEEVLLCTETASQGFFWDNESSKGKRTGFKPRRFIVEVISEKGRDITLMKGNTRGGSRRYICHRPYAPWSSSKNEEDQRISRQIVCNDHFGADPWIFHDDTFMSANFSGPPTGGSTDLNAWIAYGTCVKY